MGNNYFINSIQRAFDILELFNYDVRELGISDIARELGLHKSTVHRIVTTLESKGILEQNPDSGKYRLGLKLYRLGLFVFDDNELIALSDTSLKKLADETGETSNLVIMDGCMTVYIAQRESSRMVRMFTKPGARVYPHCSGAGKVLLSEMDQKDIQLIIDSNGFPAYTNNTITSRNRLLDELKDVRAKGYAIDNGEREEGVMCIAAPVRNRHGVITAAISISGPANRFGQERLNGLIDKILVQAGETSHRMGYGSR